MKKRLICAVMCAVLLITALQGSVVAGDDSMNDFLFPVEDYGIDITVTKKTDEIHIRDPYVVVYGQTYFMYGTCAARGLGYGCYVSRDMENWAGPVNVFTAPEGYDGTASFWAPECHYYNGAFYLFATYYSNSTGHRGVSVFKADTPLGPFVELGGGHVTPADLDAIDGTLYVDKQGQPWMVYIDEWTTAPDGNGGIKAAKLSDDLSELISEPVLLFRARDASWSRSGVTDGPCLYETKDGKLLMLWSSFDTNGYCVAVAESSDGTLGGKWSIQRDRLYAENRMNDDDGGHAMLFTGLDGKLYVVLHSPNSNDDEGVFEKALFFEAVEKDGTLVLQNTLDYEQEQLNHLLFSLSSIIEFVTVLFGILSSFGEIAP